MDKTLERIYQFFLRSGTVTTDSRTIRPGDVFFALKGENFNGNHFAGEALEKGASLAIVDEPGMEINDRFCQVPDSLEALQALSSLHRKKMPAKIIALTGSNGKTTTKELISRVLASTYRIVATKGNLNNHIGVPLTLLSIQKSTEYAVIEMGANHEGEIRNLCRIADPDYGLITNIGKAHLEGFGGLEGVIRAKSELYHHLKSKKGVLFVNRDNHLLWELSNGTARISYGSSAECDCCGNLLQPAPNLNIAWHCQNTKTQNLQTRITGAYNFENILASICVGNYFGVRPELINQCVAGYLPDNNRSQILETERNKLIMDAYNANPSSFFAALENFSLLETKARMVILGDMMELGEYAKEEHEAIIGRLHNLSLDVIILIGQNFQSAGNHKKFICFADTETAISWFEQQDFSGYTILLKGSRKMQLEKLIPFL